MLEKILEIIHVAEFLRALLFGGIATAIVCLVRGAFILPFSKHKLWEKAGKEGHGVTAYLKKRKFISPHDDPRSKREITEWYCVYHYTYQGKIYRYRTYYRSDYDVPKELHLRFLNSPRYARPQEKFTGFEWDFVFRWFLILSLVSLVLIIVANLLR